MKLNEERVLSCERDWSKGGGQMSRVWMITGCSRGLGKAMAEAVLATGDHLFATARRTEDLADLVARHGERVSTYPLDVSDPDAAVGAVEAAVAVFGRLDILVNNAGYGTIGSVEDTAMEEVRRQIEVNLFGTIYTTKAAVPFMRRQHAGHIIQVSSVGGRVGALGRAPYSAAKWGVEGFSEALAKEVEPLGIKVTIIEPGGFRTGFASDPTTRLTYQPEYGPTVGRAAKFQADYDGKQPGDPARAAQVLLHVAQMQSPPLRLPVGTDAVNAIREADGKRASELDAWLHLSTSTEY